MSKAKRGSGKAQRKADRRGKEGKPDGKPEKAVRQEEAVEAAAPQAAPEAEVDAGVKTGNGKGRKAGKAAASGKAAGDGEAAAKGKARKAPTPRPEGGVSGDAGDVGVPAGDAMSPAPDLPTAEDILRPLRAKAAEAKAVLDAARAEADVIRKRAEDRIAAAKRAYGLAVGPYRDTCRRAGVECEFPGMKAPSIFPRARFLVDRAKDGLRVLIQGRPETEEVIKEKELADSIWRAASDYCTRHFGEETTGGRARGLGLRFRAALAGE